MPAALQGPVALCHQAFSVRAAECSFIALERSCPEVPSRGPVTVPTLRAALGHEETGRFVPLHPRRPSQRHRQASEPVRRTSQHDKKGTRLEEPCQQEGSPSLISASRTPSTCPAVK